MLTVEIGFENCDVLSIPADKIKLMFAKNINDEISIRNGRRIDFKTCEEFFMVVDGKWIEGMFYPFNNKEIGGEESIGNRLRYGDIVSVNYKEEDEEKPEDSIYVPWTEEDDYHNDYQKWGYCRDGYFWVSVMREEKEGFKELKKNWGCL